MLLSITAAYLSLVGAEIENSLIAWCQSSDIFPTMARSGSLPPCPTLWPAAVGAASCQVLGGTSAFQLWNVRDAVQEGGVSWDRNQTGSPFLLHCSNAVGRWGCPSTREGRFWPSLFSWVLQDTASFSSTAQLPGDVRITWCPSVLKLTTPINN